jgi:hypothetical protein
MIAYQKDLAAVAVFVDDDRAAALFIQTADAQQLSVVQL